MLPPKCSHPLCRNMLVRIDGQGEVGGHGAVFQEKQLKLAVAHLPFEEEREGVEQDDADRDVGRGARRNDVAHGEHSGSIACARLTRPFDPPVAAVPIIE